MGRGLPLDLLLVALPLELLDVLLAIPLLRLALLFKYFDSFVEGFNGCSLHLDFLKVTWVTLSYDSAHSGWLCIPTKMESIPGHLPGMSWCTPHRACRTLCSSPGTAGGIHAASSPLLQYCPP